MIGLFYRKERDYRASNLRFAYLLREYPEADIVGDALYHQGRNYLDLEQPEQAAAAFSQFLENYPGHPSAPDARSRLNDLGGVVIQNSSREPESTPQPSFSSSGSLNGNILTLRDGTATTDLLRNDGLQEGMRLRVYRGETEVGIMRITTIYDGFSIGEIESLLPGMMAREDDRVCCPISAP
jgi:tetratricopeptide (TPR) repeat protein